MSKKSDKPGQHDGDDGHHHSRNGFRLFARLRAYFLAGILVTAPIGITAALAWWVINYIDKVIVPLVPDRYNPDTYIREVLGAEIGLPGLGLVILVVVITFIGAFAAGLVGRWVVRLGEKILDRMPIIRSLYKLTKQIFQTVLQNQSDAFRQAVLIEYPRKGLWAIAFLTANTQGEITRKLARPTVNVFLPTTPNPTSGFLLFVPREDIIVLDMPVEDSVKLVISAGIVHPGEHLAGEPLAGEPLAGEPLAGEHFAAEKLAREHAVGADETDEPKPGATTKA